MNMDKIDDLITEARAISASSVTVNAGANMSAILREGLKKFCENNRISMRTGMDLAVYTFLKDRGHEFQARLKETEFKIVVCSQCTHVHKRAVTQCEKCGSTDLL